MECWLDVDQLQYLRLYISNVYLSHFHQQLLIGTSFQSVSIKVAFLMQLAMRLLDL